MTKSLSERLRVYAAIAINEIYADHFNEAADALDRQAAEIALMKEGRQLHDELADHLEHELAQQSALLAQAAAALESLTKDPPSSLSGEPDTDCEVVLKMREIAREALAAIRAKEQS
jgi:hypothetical protein